MLSGFHAWALLPRSSELLSPPSLGEGLSRDHKHTNMVQKSWVLLARGIRGSDSPLGAPQETGQSMCARGKEIQSETQPGHGYTNLLHLPGKKLEGFHTDTSPCKGDQRPARLVEERRSDE